MEVRGNWAEYLKPGAKRVFADEYPELPNQYTRYFNVLTSKRAFEDDLVSAGLGTAGRKPEGVNVPLDSASHRGKVRYTHLTYGLGYEITEEIVEDDLYGVVQKLGSKGLARSIRDTEERVAAAVFNLMFSTQQAYDGVSVISTAHPTATTDTQSNRPAVDADLGFTTLEAGLEHFMDMENDRGLKITGIQPGQIVVPPALSWLAKEILGGQFKPFTSDNTVNVLKDQGLTVSVYNYLTDADAWYLLAPKEWTKLTFYWRRKPTFRNSFDDRAGVAFFMVTARFDAGISDWRGVYGSPGA